MTTMAVIEPAMTPMARLWVATTHATVIVMTVISPAGMRLRLLDLLEATDRLDATDAGLTSGEHDALLEPIRTYERAAAERIDTLRLQLSRAEEFAATLRARLEENGPPAES